MDTKDIKYVNNMLFMKEGCLNMFQLFETFIGSYVISYVFTCSFDAFGEKVKVKKFVQTFAWLCI